MRWLTVSVPGDPDRQILLEKPGPPSIDDATAEQVRELVTKGATGGTAHLHHRRLPQDLRELARQGRRVHPGADRARYGIDCGLRDPFGNHIRIVQPK